MNYTNPIIRGFYPDPSVCKANGAYYLVCSTFQFFPGLPLFKSKNLTDWEQIGHVLTRKSQLDLTGAGASGGLYAPTIRYHNGRFYVVVTDTGGKGHFYVYTDDIEGEWSEPVFVDRPGIDPSLLFDGGKTYFISNGQDDFGDDGVTLCELDIETGKKIGSAKCITHGTGGRFIEAPHLYHIGEYYYLLVAEGGTEYGHTECLFRGREPFGEYESCPANPILTNRHLGGYYIQAAGHGDIVEDDDGQWWMVHLAFRQISKWRQFHHLGRETFLVPVFFTEDGWMKVGTDGTCRAAYTVENGSCTAQLTTDYPRYDWKIIPKEACYIRCPDYNNYHFTDSADFTMKGTEATLDGQGNVTFVGMRQKEFDMTAVLGIAGATLTENQSAGITAYMSESDHYDI